MGIEGKFNTPLFDHDYKREGGMSEEGVMEREKNFWGTVGNFIDITGPDEVQIIQWRSLLGEISDISKGSMTIDNGLNNQKGHTGSLTEHAQNLIGQFGREFVTEKIEDHIKFLEHELNETTPEKESGQPIKKDDSYKWN